MITLKQQSQEVFAAFMTRLQRPKHSESRNPKHKLQGYIGYILDLEACS